MKNSLVALLQRHKQFIRFLIGGAYNTLFGFVLFAVLYSQFGNDYHYILLATFTSIASITNAYIVYRLFVFKSKGNIIKEYLRFYIVYGASSIISLVIMFVMVETFDLNPILTQGLIIITYAFTSYFGHQKFSFQVPKSSSNQD